MVPLALSCSGKSQLYSVSAKLNLSIKAGFKKNLFVLMIILLLCLLPYDFVVTF